MAVPISYLKAILVTTIPLLLISAILGFAGLTNEIPYPFNWIFAFITAIFITISITMAAYFVIAVVHG